MRWRRWEELSRSEVAAVARRGKEGLLSGEEEESGSFEHDGGANQ